MKDIIKVQINVTKTEPDKCDAELLCIGVFSEPEKLDKTAKEIDVKLDGAITKVIELGDFKGKPLTSALIYTDGRIAAKRVLLVGLGEKKKATLNTLREAASHAANRAVSMKVKRMAVALHLAFGKRPEISACGLAMAQGVHFGGYRYDEFMTNDDKNGRSESLSVDLIDSDTTAVRELKKGAQIGAVVGEAQSIARTIANRPSNVMYPAELAAEAKKIAAELPGLTCTIFDDKQLEQKKMGGIIAVGQGSSHKPRMIVLKWNPRSKSKKNVPSVGLIGKAITFDSGGISIKPSAHMDSMKMDKTGGAVVLGAITAAAKLKLPVKVTAVICAAENAPSGDSYRPGDVITTFSGKTVEVLNTDAEGRMVLCDGIHYAKRLKCEPIIDVATLTGACMVALGTHKAGVMGNDEKLLKQLTKAAEISGEPVWRLPSGDEYTEELKSKIADLKNIGSKYGGACTAASFLGEFAGKTKWAHLDIAGKMEPSEPMKKYAAEGSIGFGVRLLVEYLTNQAGK